MDTNRFDYLIQSFVTVSPRRGLLRLLALLSMVGPLAAVLDDERATAKRRRHHLLQEQRKKKKKKKCAKAGQTTSKKRKQCCQGLVKDGSGICAQPPQPVSGCVPTTCAPNACGSVPDGCGGTLSCGGCGGNSLCDGGLCQPCTVRCLSDPATCGARLQQALDEGGTVYVCPGLYQGNFTLNAAVRVIGAMEDGAVVADTFLRGGPGRVLSINPGVGLVALERLVLFGGTATDGGGIFHQGTTLRLTDCIVDGTGNGLGGGIHTLPATILEMTRCEVHGRSSGGGGIYSQGTTTLTDCKVKGNRASDAGGGLYVRFGTTTLAGSTEVFGNEANVGGGIFVQDGTLVIAETSRVTQNTALDTGSGGGIANFGAVTLQGAEPSPIVFNNCPDNCAGTNPVAKCAATPVSC